MNDPREVLDDRADAVRAGGSALLGIGGLLWCFLPNEYIAAGLMLAALFVLGRASPTLAQRRLWNALEHYVAHEEAKHGPAGVQFKSSESRSADGDDAIPGPALKHPACLTG
jgi:hypothetical protein